MSLPALYAVCIAALENETLYRAAYHAASPARRLRTDRLRSPEDQRRALWAELLLRYALRENGVRFPEGFVIGEYGKPYLPGGELFFNLSHAGEWVVCAVSASELGCDIERIGHGDINVAKRFFTAEEYADIASKPSPEERAALFCRYWTLKESFLKATGRGLSLPLNSFSVRLGEKTTVIGTADEREFRFREYAAFPGYRCAVCARGEPPEGVCTLTPEMLIKL